jgi:hypothetical protein
MKSLLVGFWAGAICVVLSGSSIAAGLDSDLAIVKKIGPKGVGHEEAVDSLRRLSKADVKDVVEILEGMKGTGPLARNWLRSAVESVVQRADGRDEPLPTDRLVKFLEDTSNDPYARRLTYEILSDHDADFSEQWKSRFLKDPSLELRRESVQVVLDDAQASLKSDNKDSAKDKFGVALTAARDVDQIISAADALGELGTKIDVNDVMGFVTEWNLAAPFDNTDKSGFDVAYPPEKSVDLKATYQGKEGDVKWVAHETSEKFGIVDLNAALDKHKGAICYAYAEFHAEEARDVDVRLGCINGNKVWLNGELLTANHVYHANIFVDQYLAQGRLKAGKNTILVKVAQNEQDDDWAQRWQFQLRVCDALGGAVKSAK